MLDPDALDRAARTWAAQHASGAEPVAIDGKHIRGAARHQPGAKHLLVAAAEHRSGLVLGQEAVAHKSNEIPAVRTLLTALDLTGRVVTLDAMHTQDETARCLVEHCDAHYVMTAVNVQPGHQRMLKRRVLTQRQGIGHFLDLTRDFAPSRTRPRIDSSRNSSKSIAATARRAGSTVLSGEALGGAAPRRSPAKTEDPHGT